MSLPIDAVAKPRVRRLPWLIPLLIVMALLVAWFLVSKDVFAALALCAVVYFAKTSVRQLRGSILLFGLLGPFIGLIVTLLCCLGWPVYEMFGRHQDASPTEVASTMSESVATGAGIWLVALVFGGAPALATGLAYYAMRRRASGARSGAVSIMAVAAIGAVASVLWFAFLFKNNVVPDRESPLPIKERLAFLGFLSLPGAIAALVCSLVANRWIDSTRRREVDRR